MYFGMFGSRQEIDSALLNAKRKIINERVSEYDQKTIVEQIQKHIKEKSEETPEDLYSFPITPDVLAQIFSPCLSI